jgi:superoxide dismutase
MPYELPPLPYPYDALEPHIDEETMRLHHDKHHQTYVNNLNKALEGTEQDRRRKLEQVLDFLDQIPMEVRTAVRNSGGGRPAAPSGAHEPGRRRRATAARKAIDDTFGGVDELSAGHRRRPEALAAGLAATLGPAWSSRHAEPGQP